MAVKRGLGQKFFLLLLLGLGIPLYQNIFYYFSSDFTSLFLRFEGLTGWNDYREHFTALAATGVFRMHVIGGGLALLLGGIQLLSLPPRRFHRLIGRAYLAAVSAGGIAGMILSFSVFTSGWTCLGFFLLALAWLYSGFTAFQKIRVGDLAAHRRWILRNYALTLAAVSLRIGYAALTKVSGSLYLAQQVSAWSCWIPNLVAVEIFLWLRPSNAAVRAEAQPVRK